MRFLLLIAVWMFFGWSIAATADPMKPVFSLEKVENGQIVTQEGAVIAFYGVRLAEKAKDPALFQDLQRFLLKVLGGTPFTLRRAAFVKKGVAQNRYGDLHGQILLDNGRWLQEELVIRGFGVWSGAANYPTILRERLIAAEKAAALEMVGLWRDFTVIDANRPPRVYWDGQFTVATGIVVDVYRGPSATYLNFGEDWRQDFTVAIPSIARKKFQREGWKLAELKNRSITVRGPVRYYNGPYMELDFPEQLELSEAAGEG